MTKTEICALVIIIIVVVVAFLFFPYNKPVITDSNEIVLSSGLYTVKCPGKLTIGKTVQPAILVCQTGSVIEEIEYINK